jgi:CRISPR-associated protein Csx10
MSNNSSIKQHIITFEMLSDWHIGTGSGIPGSVDALLARDADGFPCIPAKTVIGIWRDAMETLTLGLDGDEKTKNWQNWVDVIFGSQPNIDKNPNATPRPAILSIQPARIDENLREAIKNSSKLDQTKYKQALTFVKPNTQIEKNGTAKTESLRFTEMGRIGSVLKSKFEIDFAGFEDNAQKELVKALLTASAGLVERIGGNRRRGSGRCEMKVDFGEIDAIAVLRKYQENLSLDIPELQPKDELEAAQKVDSDEWKRIEYSLTLQTPVAIVTNTLGNVSETLDFIPGTYLLPHITRRLKGVSSYVASGDFQVLPATICIEGNRGLPIPKVINYHKVEGGFDRPNTVYNRLEEDISGGVQKKNYREGYVSDLGGNGNQLPFYETTKKILLMHNTVEDEFQRPTENVGGVFSRQAIEAGTVLKGEIRFKASIEDKVKSLENYTNYVRLGTSKKDDYGLAELNFETIKKAESNITATANLIVYLASDVLLRNDNLRQTNSICDLKNELEKTFGKNTLKCVEKKSLIQVRRIESWHEGWGFPRPTLTAMTAGSVAVFEVVSEIKPQELQNLELSGIGERRGEGYGQIKFNPKILMNPINSWTVPQKIKNEKTEPAVILSKDEKAFALAFQIEKTAWRKQIENKVLVLTDDYTQREEKLGWTIKGEENKNTKRKANETKPNSSQAGSLRSVFQSLKQSKDEKVIGWLDHLEKTDNRRDKWTNESLKILRQIIDDENKIWELLGDSFPKPITENSKKELQSQLWAEAVKSLFDACARAHKRNEERKQNNREAQKDGEKN